MKGMKHMTRRKLNVSIMQTSVADTISESLEIIESSLARLMKSYIRPELVVGIEYGLGREPQKLIGETTKRLGELAKEYGIYFIPGTMLEIPEDPNDDSIYNTCPIFGPDGEMITYYRKKVPFKPGEVSSPSNDDYYCTFKIEEKDITVGLIICYDQFFPEITRTVALEGAEIIICPSYDPMEFDHIPDIIPQARALENEAYFVWTCGAGENSKGTCCGKSTIASPEGKIVYQCSYEPALITKTLDMDDVFEKRNYGIDQHLNSLRTFDVKYPYAGKLETAPVFKDMKPLSMNVKDFKESVAKLGIGNLSELK